MRLLEVDKFFDLPILVVVEMDLGHLLCLPHVWLAVEHDESFVDSAMIAAWLVAMTSLVMVAAVTSLREDRLLVLDRLDA